MEDQANTKVTRVQFTLKDGSSTSIVIVMNGPHKQCFLEAMHPNGPTTSMLISEEHMKEHIAVCVSSLLGECTSTPETGYTGTMDNDKASSFIAVRNKHGRYFTGIVGNRWAGFGKAKRFPPTRVGATAARLIGDHSLEQWTDGDGVHCFVGNVHTFNEHRLPRE